MRADAAIRPVTEHCRTSLAFILPLGDDVTRKFDIGNFEAS
jgi:hypothetical protein